MPSYLGGTWTYCTPNSIAPVDLSGDIRRVRLVRLKSCRRDLLDHVIVTFHGRHEFTDRLVPFLKILPGGHKFAIEVRNRNWLDAEFASLLRDQGIALVLQDRSWMPNPSEIEVRSDYCGLDVYTLARRPQSHRSTDGDLGQNRC